MPVPPQIRRPRLRVGVLSSARRRPPLGVSSMTQPLHSCLERPFPGEASLGDVISLDAHRTRLRRDCDLAAYQAGLLLAPYAFGLALALMLPARTADTLFRAYGGRS